MKEPKIRFKGFQGEWERAPLLDVVTLYNGLTYTPNDIRDHGTLVLRSSNVQEGEISLFDNVYVRSEVANSPNVKKGDIIVVVRNGSRTLIGKHAQIKSDMPNTVIGAFMAGMHTDEPEFLNALLSTSRFDNEVTINLGATINQITKGTFHSMKFLFPNKKEQKALGSYFQHLDSLIQSTTKKIESLKQVKAASLQSMFPQEGETTPRVRFKEFQENIIEFPLWKYTIWDKHFKEVESWKQPKVISYPYMLANELALLKKGKGDVFLLTTGGSLGYTTKEMAGTFLCKGEVVSIPWGGTANVKYVNGLFVTADNRIATSSDTNVLLNKYLYYLLVSKTNILNSFYRGASIKHPSMLDVLEMKISVPSRNEQQKIADYFTNLDRLITLQTQRLEKLKQIKAACLDNMFV